jgi:hypothetical protein
MQHVTRLPDGVKFTSQASQRLIEVCRRQHKSLSTERVYSLWLRDYCRFMASLDPTLPSEKKVEKFLTIQTP